MDEINKPWQVFYQNQFIRLNSYDYLNYLLEKSKQAIKNHNIRKMIEITWDLEELKNTDSFIYKTHRHLIDGEIASLLRLTKSEKIH